MVDYTEMDRARERALIESEIDQMVAEWHERLWDQFRTIGPDVFDAMESLLCALFEQNKDKSDEMMILTLADIGWRTVLTGAFDAMKARVDALPGMETCAFCERVMPVADLEPNGYCQKCFEELMDDVREAEGGG